MSGKRILDAIALLRVGKNIAYNHFAIRLRQAEVYSKTSSIVKAIQGRPAPGHAFSSQNFNQAPSRASGDHPVPEADKHTGPQQSLDETPGIKQTHFYDKSKNNTTANPASREDLDIEQTKSSRAPLPDGTIPPTDSPLGGIQEDASIHLHSSAQSSTPTPTSSQLSSQDAMIAQRRSESQIPSKSAGPPAPEAPEFSIDQEQDTFYQPPGQAKPVLSALPRVRLPKVENDVQGGDSHIPSNINADVYYSGSEQEKNAEPSDEQLSQLFHSPRSAKLLGNKTRQDQTGFGAKRFHTSAKYQQQSVEAEKKELKQLAEDMAKDIQGSDVGGVR